MTQHILLIDASGFAHRAYHAFGASYRESDGLPTGALIGFISLIWHLLGRAQADAPTHACAVFDWPGKNFRHRLYPAYKANRAKNAAKRLELDEQLPLMREAARILGLSVAEQKGYEADDVIATLASRAAADGMRTTIVSSDKDFCQLVKDGVCEIVDPVAKRRLLEKDVRDPKKFGVPPELVPDVQALCGDAVDNIPGVPSIGLLGAAGLIRRYGSISALVTAIDKGTLSATPVIRAQLRRERKNLLLYRKLAILKTNVPVDVRFVDLEVKPIVRAHLVEMFKALGALPKLDRLLGEPAILARPAAPVTDPLAWWRTELKRSGQKLTETPQCGWYRRRLVRGGSWVPARIWREAEVDFLTEKPTGRDVLCCMLGPDRVDAVDEWGRLAMHPISEVDYDLAMKTAEWVKRYAPHEPESDPHKPIDWNSVPL